ncbi:MAG: NAD-dependent epimerase/dehydratase family protein [Candidatus Micrarchaeia archaeon]|jgi:nucleoside-diphosphate-sugar epimerase
MIYVTGASGRLGREVMKKIPEAVALVRKPAGFQRQIIVDYDYLEGLKETLRDAKVIIHLAGSMDFGNEKELRKANVGITRHIVNAAPAGAKIILASSISVYGKRIANLPANERTRTNPDSAYAKTKLEAEKIVTNERGNSIVLRIGTIYGPKIADYYRVLSMIEHGKMKTIGDGKNHVPFVHIEDAARAIAGAVKARPGIYVVCGGNLTQEEIYSIAAKELKVTPPKAHVPVEVAMAAVQVEEIKARIFGKKPKITREHVSVLSSDRIFDYSKAKGALGFRPRALARGIMEMVAEYKKFHGSKLKQ